MYLLLIWKIIVLLLLTVIVTRNKTGVGQMYNCHFEYKEITQEEKRKPLSRKHNENRWDCLSL